MKLLLVLLLLLLVPTASAACSATPQLAVQRAISGLADGQENESATGFRVVDILSDPLTHQAWLRVESCASPSRPRILVPLHLPVSLTSVSSISSVTVPTEVSPVVPAKIAIRAGDPIRVTWRSASSQIHINAIAEGSGHIGEVISARLLSLDPASTAVRHVRALIQSTGEVVYQP